MEQDTIYRTTPARTGKMMAIMLGICIVGGAIFFALWDYWISEPAPVVAMMAGAAVVDAPAPHTGDTLTVDLTFVEADDFITMGFNAAIGEEGSNPTINMNVGDKVVFNLVNEGVSFHAFGVTANDEGLEGIIPGTEVGTSLDPLRPGQSGSSEFIAAEEGTYYYICPVPGHRLQGMVGEIIVGPAADTPPPTEAAAPTGVSHNFKLDFVEGDDFVTMAFNALPGEEGHNPELRVASGDEVTIDVEHKGISLHSFAILSNPNDLNSIVWDAEIASATSPLSRGQTGSVTFTAGAPGTYYYVCTVPGHVLQGMQGTFIVE